MRPYDNSRYLLIEEISGVTLYTNIPWNRGENMSSEHRLQIKTAYKDRQIQLYEQDENNWKFVPSQDEMIPVPKSIQEGVVSLEYRWLNRRPHKYNQMLPKRGHGVSFSIDHANSSISGYMDYTQKTIPPLKCLKLLKQMD